MTIGPKHKIYAFFMIPICNLNVSLKLDRKLKIKEKLAEVGKFFLDFHFKRFIQFVIVKKSDKCRQYLPRSASVNNFPCICCFVVDLHHLVCFFLMGRCARVWKVACIKTLSDVYLADADWRIQCDQIGNKLYYKSIPNICWLFGQFGKPSLFKSSWCGYFWKNLGYFWKNLGYFWKNFGYFWKNLGYFLFQIWSPWPHTK